MTSNTEARKALVQFRNRKADAAGDALATYSGLDTADPVTSVVDLMSDLLHLVEREGGISECVIQSAMNHYRSEGGKGHQADDIAVSTAIGDYIPDETTNRFGDAVEVASDAFWLAFAAEYPEIKTGDFPADASSEWEMACGDAARVWLEANTTKTAWQARIERYAQLAEHHDVGEGRQCPSPEDLSEATDYALVVQGHDADAPALVAFETFGELCEYAADCVLGADLLLAAYDLARIRPIGLHVSTPVVTESMDPGAAPVNPWK